MSCSLGLQYREADKKLAERTNTDICEYYTKVVSSLQTENRSQLSRVTNFTVQKIAEPFFLSLKKFDFKTFENFFFNTEQINISHG